MRKFFTILFVLLLSTSLMAQVRTGNIYGKVMDEEGNPLPGVTCTLSGSLTAPMTSISSPTGVFRFISLPASDDYVVKSELEGFKTEIQESIIISIGANVNLIMVMSMGAIEEQIIVTAVTPVVDTKKTTVGQTVTRMVLQSLPSARDPWVVLQQAPGVSSDRENIGGSESGQQSSSMAKGGGEEQWSMDGVTITDFGSHSSPLYYDFDSFEEMQITLGGADVEVQGAGIQMNLVTRRGGNDVSIGGRFYFTDGSKFQADNLTDALREEGIVGTNRIRVIKDFGFNMGGPLLRDKAWWWLSYGVQDINNSNLFGTYEATMLNNYAGKFNVQLIPENRFEAMLYVNGKEKTARSASYSFPGGWHQTGAFHFGSPVFKLQDEHMFGDNLFVSIKFAYGGGGFNMIPEDDLDGKILTMRNMADAVWQNSYWAYRCLRPLMQYNFLANYFNDDFLGVSHEMKVGFEYSDRGIGTSNATAGNVYGRYNYSTNSVDISGDGFADMLPAMKRIEMYRASPYEVQGYSTAITGFFQDTITVGNLTLNLGLRYDHQFPRTVAYEIGSIDIDNAAVKNNFSPAAAAALDAVLPGYQVAANKPDFAWSYLMPRIGLTYDLFGDGKTILKGSIGTYREYMGSWFFEYFLPGGTGGWMDFWWLDNFSAYGGNSDGTVDLNELYWNYPGAKAPVRAFDDSGSFIGDPSAGEGNMYGGYDINNPQASSASRDTLTDDYPSRLTSEAIITLEKEIMADFGAAIDFTYRKNSEFGWYINWNPSTGEKASQAEYVQAGNVPGSLPGLDLGEGAGKPYYLQAAGVPYRWDRYREIRPDYYRDYMGVSLRFNKRLSSGWMFNGSATFQINKVHYGNNGYLDPTSMWVLDDQIYAPEIGGSSGKVSTPQNQKWMFKLAGLYQLPLNFNISFTFNARQGNPIFHTMDIIDYNSPNPQDTGASVYLDQLEYFRLPDFMNLNLRLEKVINAGDTGRIYLMADLFNVLNSATMIRRYENFHGTYYPHNNSFSENATDFMANEILNPRVLRVGVRFQF
ncbi:hypothetical protein ES707_19380 [subsurface metagenome]